MKKQSILAILIAALLVLTVFTGCAANSKMAAADTASAPNGYYDSKQEAAAAEYPTGTELTLTGRLQSRTYLKNLGETSETRTAYEFSVSACERVPELAIF